MTKAFKGRKLPKWATLLTDCERCATRVVQLRAIANGKIDEFNKLMDELRVELQKGRRSKKAVALLNRLIQR